MATVTNPTGWHIYSHELKLTFGPHEIVEVEDEIAKTLNNIILKVELGAKLVVDEVEKVVEEVRPRKTKAQTGLARPDAETR